MNAKALALMRRAARVQRMHTFDAHHRQTVGEHTFGVLAILMHICEGTDLLTLSLIKAAMIHDAPEAELGDIPAPAKWNNEALELAMKDAEAKVYGDHGLPLASSLGVEERNLLKFADYMELAMFALEEESMGNRAILKVCRNALEAISFKNIAVVTPKAMDLFNDISAQFHFRGTLHHAHHGE